VTQRQPYTIIGYSPSLQQDTADQELLKDMIIAVMKQSNNKMVKVFSDAVDLQKSQNPVEYILKTMALLKEVFNG
jgi:predicted transcriptional regulator